MRSSPKAKGRDVTRHGNTSTLCGSHAHQFIPGLFLGLLLLDVPQSYGVATVMATVIPCNTSVEFPWKWRYASRSQGLVFLLRDCIEQRLVTVTTSFHQLTTARMGDTHPAMHPMERWS